MKRFRRQRPERFRGKARLGTGSGRGVQGCQFWLVLFFGLVTALRADPNRIDSWMVANRVAQEADTRANLRGENLPLDEVYRLVMERNPAVVRARHELEQAAGQRLTVRSAALPKALLGLPAGYLGPKGDADSRVFVLITGGFRQPLFDVSVPPSWRLGNLAIPAAQQNLNLIVSNRLHAARRAYLRALHARGLLGVLSEIEEALQRNEAFERRRVEAGLGARADLIRAEIQKLNRRPERDALEAQYQALLVELADLLGVDLKTGGPVSFRPLGSLAYQPFPLELEQLNAEAQATRPDVMLLEILVRQNVEQIRLASAGVYPVIELVANGQAIPGGAFTDLRPDAIRAGDNEQNSEIRFGPSLTWQIYDGGAAFGRKDSAVARREAAQIRLQALRDDIPRALALVSRRLRTSEEKVRVLGSSVALAERTLQVVERTLEQGLAGQLDILEAQQSLFDTKAGLLNALLEHALALAELDLITGRYLQFTHAPEPVSAR